MTISNASLAWLAASALFGIALPVCAVVYWRRSRKDVRWAPILIGALTFVLFALVLEPLLHQVCLVMDNPISRTINGSPYLYMLYGGLAAGVFEETGRYLAFRFPLRRYPERDTAVSCGLGHGGIEALILLGVNMAAMLAFALTYRRSPLAALEMAGGLEAAAQMTATLSNMTLGAALLGMLERVLAMLLHVALSIFVFVAVRDRRQRSYFPFAVALHAIADMPAALYQKGLLPLGVVELWMAVVTLYAFRSARKLFLEETDP